jgi:hypothetical protein
MVLTDDACGSASFIFGWEKARALMSCKMSNCDEAFWSVSRKIGAGKLMRLESKCKDSAGCGCRIN